VRDEHSFVDLLEAFGAPTNLLETDIDGPKEVGTETERAQFIPQRRLLDIGFSSWPDDEAWCVTRHA
jgi:hypothetical protein